MVTSNRVFVHFDKLCQFMVRELYDCKAKPLAWSVVMSHIHKIPQFQYRCDINQFIPIDVHGVECTAKAIKGAIDTISHLIAEAAPGIGVIAPEAKDRLSEVGDTAPVIIIRNTAPAAPAAPTPEPTKAGTRKGNKREWGYSNALFGGPNKAWYDFTEGNVVMKMAKKEFKDMKDFCFWRVEKSRPALPTNIEEVRKEYKRFKTPPIDLNAMQPAKAAEAPTYRKVNLTNAEDENEK